MKNKSLLSLSIALIMSLADGDIFAYCLKDGIEDALKQSKAIKVSEFKEEAVKYNELGAKAGFMPKIYIRGGGQAYSSDIDGTTSKGNALQGELVLQQNIYDGFATTNRVGSAKTKVAIERLLAKEVKTGVMKMAILAYQDMILARSRVELRNLESSLMKTTLKEVEIKHSKALVNSTDLAEAYAQASATDAQYVAARSILQKKKAHFENVFGKSVPQRLEEITDDILQKAVPNTLEHCYELMDKKNAQIEIRRLRLRDFNFLYDAASGAFLPSVDIEGKVSHISTGNESRQMTAGISVSMPLLHMDAIAKKKALGREMLANEEEFVEKYDDIKESVLGAWHDYISIKEMLSYYAKNVKAKEQAVNAMKIESDIGTKTMTDLMRARKELFESRIKVMEGRRSLIDAAVHLIYLIGGLDASLFEK